MPSLTVCSLACNIVTVVTFSFLQGMYTPESKKTSVFSVKKLFFLGFFHTLPFFQLEVAFFGEFLASILIVPFYERFEFIFCMTYPILMGAVQLINQAINEKNDFQLDLLAEAYSVLFASLPYKMLFLGIDAIWIALTILGIKTGYKLIAFIIIPIIKYFNEERVNRNKIKAEKQKISESIKLSSQNILNVAQEDQKIAEGLDQITSIKGNCHENEKNLDFALKFFLLQISDLVSNVGVINFTLIINGANLIGFELKGFDSDFIQILLLENFVNFKN